MRKQYPLIQHDVLATENFYIETPSIPYTNGENKYEEDATA